MHFKLINTQLVTFDTTSVVGNIFKKERLVPGLAVEIDKMHAPLGINVIISICKII